ncbi:MAG: hypothetical protein EPN56_02675 [Rhodanobacter sp.]|nr:MAG: hypothetical protein EPN78_04105 [Rhodanobacter sp.]TAM12423.1 MAG: hypothetical protein EPN66_06940 [Rhodanobacter sp.]TAM37092.1 MAG: hypothetical protein EPN56_02675 [Rhodanobacter sp.]
MPDMVVQYVDTQLVERIRLLANERQCSMNEVMLFALRRGVGLSTAPQFSESHCDPATLDIRDGGWGAAEQGAFREALRALAQTQPTQFAPEAMGVQAAAGGGAE